MNFRLSLAILPLALAAACQKANDPSASPTGAPLAVLAGVSYPDADAIYNQGRAITPNVPSATGTFTSWSIAPALPLGLTFDSATGIIDGRPLRLSSRRDYTVTANGPGGSRSGTLALRVVPFSNDLDPHQDGQAPGVLLTGAFWGRRANVYDLDSSTGIRRLQARNLVIGESIASDANYTVETQLVTGLVEVTIRHRLGTSQFESAYAALEQALTPIPVVDPLGLPPFPMIPRNASIVLRLDDLLRRDTLAPDTLRIVAENAPVALHVLPDPNHGGFADTNGDGVEEFVPTRVILDPQITLIDQLADGTLPGNGLGLPASSATNLANVVVRIPTRVDVPSGQMRIVANLAGNGLSISGNGPVDLASPTQDVVRGARSGGPTDVTGDPFNGFLFDATPPALVGEQAGVVSNIVPDVAFGRGVFSIDFTYASPFCVHVLEIGDVLVQAGGRVFSVIDRSGLPSGPGAQHVAGARVRMVAGFAPATDSATVWTRYTTTTNSVFQPCFFRFTDITNPPSTGVDPNSAVVVRFDEPVDLATATNFDGIAMLSQPPGLFANQVIPTAFLPSVDSTSVRLQPAVPLRHAAGASETIFMRVSNGALGVRDLAGNTFANPGLLTGFDLDPSAPTENSGGLVFRFRTADELANNGLPELRGQFLRDLTAGTIRSRPVNHFAAIVDRTKPIPAIMPTFFTGVANPLNPLGCKLQHLWRYFDAGHALLDESQHNVDVEGLAWAPRNGNVVADAFGGFEIRLAHSRFLPDESLNAALLPSFPNSGLITTFANNLLDATQDPQRVVHPRARGYTLDPNDRFTTPTGTVMMPYPLNRGLPVGQFEYYTWRDTSITARAAPFSSGATAQIEANVLGVPGPGLPYVTGNVPTVGLPLLLEFRCYPDGSALGVNSFDVSIASASSPRPNFRAFSAGGISAGGIPVMRDPDLQATATGGFDPTTGAPTMGVENTFYLGQMNLVTRISRAHTIWLDAGAVTSAFAEPIAVLASQPAGTQVQLAFRGASAVSGSLTNDATSLDPYGDDAPGGPPSSVTFFNGDSGWKSSPSVLAGARWIQARISFVSNAQSGAVAELTALGLAWRY